MIYDLFPLLACQIRSCASALGIRGPLEYNFFQSYRLSAHRGYQGRYTSRMYRDPMRLEDPPRFIRGVFRVF